MFTSLFLYQISAKDRILQKACPSPREILEVYGMQNEPGIVSIKQDIFVEMCPALIYQLDQRSCFKMEAPTPKLERHWSKYMHPF